MEKRTNQDCVNEIFDREVSINENVYRHTKYHIIIQSKDCQYKVKHKQRNKNNQMNLPLR